MILLATLTLEEYADQLFTVMRPQFGTLIAFAQAIGAIGALMYVFSRLWINFARAEPIDVLPLLRPLALALCLALYMPIVDTLMWFGNVLEQGTADMVSIKDDEIAAKVRERDDLWIKKREELSLTPSQDPAPTWGSQMWDSVTGLFAIDWDALQYKISSYLEMILVWLLRTLLRIITLAIRIINRFFICVMAICGPLTFGLACYDWFYSGLAAWFRRFINLLLWIPICNLFSAMMNEVYLQALQLDIDQFKAIGGASEFTTSDMTLILFYACCCLGYYLVPTVAEWILETTGLQSAFSQVSRPVIKASNAGMAVAGTAMGYGTAAVVGAARGGRNGGGVSGAARGAIDSIRNRRSQAKV